MVEAKLKKGQPTILTNQFVYSFLLRLHVYMTIQIRKTQNKTIQIHENIFKTPYLKK